MATNDKFQVNGIKETLDVFKQLSDEIGDKKSTSKVLIPSLKEAMERVQAMARMLAPSDTGQLRRTIGIIGRRPTGRDKRSKYISQGDVAIAIVSTKVIPKEVQREFAKQSKGLKGAEKSKAKRKFLSDGGFNHDQRAISQEFGTGRNPASPFMRPALESQAGSVVAELGRILKQKIEQYRSKKK